MGKKNKKILTMFACLCICIITALFGTINTQININTIYAESIEETTGEGNDGGINGDGADGGEESGEGSSGGGESAGEGTGSTGDGSEGEVEEESPIDYSQIFADGFKLTDTDIPDANLRNELLNIFKRKTEYKDIDALYSTMFNNEIFTEIVLDNKNIASLAGMELLEFGYLESISFNLNAITSFSGMYLRNATDKLTSISIANNNLMSVDFGGLNRLTYVDVSANGLDKLDLSHVVVAEGGTDIYVNVAGNKFTSMKNIILPEHRIGLTTLNIIGNNIKDIESKYFDGNKYLMSIGVQGLKECKIESSMMVDFYKTNIPGIAIQVWSTDGYQGNVVVDTITDDMITESGNVLSKKYPIGEYYFNYTLNGSAVPSKSFYDSGVFSVIPQKPVITYTYKNKTTETLGKVTGKVTVNLFTAEEGAKIFYQLNGKDWVEGNTVKCEDGGSYSIKVKAQIVTANGRVVESEVVDILVRTSLNLYISDGVMLVIVALIALTLFLVVIPIVSKKYFKKD